MHGTRSRILHLFAVRLRTCFSEAELSQRRTLQAQRRGFIFAELRQQFGQRESFDVIRDVAAIGAETVA